MKLLFEWSCPYHLCALLPLHFLEVDEVSLGCRGLHLPCLSIWGEYTSLCSGVAVGVCWLLLTLTGLYLLVERWFSHTELHSNFPGKCGAESVGLGFNMNEMLSNIDSKCWGCCEMLWSWALRWCKGQIDTKCHELDTVMTSVIGGRLSESLSV